MSTKKKMGVVVVAVPNQQNNYVLKQHHCDAVLNDE
jgi:hypothetical protein